MSRFYLIVVLSIFAYASHGAPGPAAEPPGPAAMGISGLTSREAVDTLPIETALSSYTPGAPLISPDGAKAIIPVRQVGKGAGLPASHLWLLDIPTKTIRQFTSSPKGESSPKWSPDSKKLAFLSGRSGSSQIFLMDMAGGEALQLTESPTDISSFEWNPDGASLLFITHDKLPDSIKKRQDDKFDEKVMSQSEHPSRVYRISIADKSTKRILAPDYDIDELTWLPSGKELLLVVSPIPSPELPSPKLIKFNLTDSTSTTLASPGHSFYGNILPSPDGATAVFVGARDSGPMAFDLFLHKLTENKFENITAKSLDRHIQRYKFINNHTLLALVQMGFTKNLYQIQDNGTATPHALKDNIQAFDVANDGTIVYVKSSFDQLPEVYLAKPGGQGEKVSSFNKAIPLVSARIFTYKSFDGKTIEGALYKPSNTTAATTAATAKSLPLIAFIHGGPTGSFTDTYSAWAQLLAQNGYAVFCPNIRGSGGYSWDFLTSNRKDWGGNDYKDMMAGIDYLIKNENIDSARLGISGWSYGGYMAEWAITQTRRFKASVSGAGMANLASEFGTESGAAYDYWFWGTPYENLDLFYKHSPIAYLKNAKTPTLIIQGEEDATDPIGQSQELYRGLRYNNVPCELVLYPREPHGFREINHNIDFYRRMIAWFKKYMSPN
ncbi:MAG: S9 family peptidase [Bacteroidetes bacterium]|nr:S9 family peptidase [Bacteroidota bacterium]